MLLQITEPEEAFSEDAPVQAVGIDLGTTHCVVAISQNHQPEVLMNAEKGLFPSIVAYSHQGNKQVGASAKALLQKTPEDVVTSIKRLMGRGLDDEVVATFPHSICQTPQGISLNLGGKLLTPVEISGDILSHLRDSIEETLGYRVFEAVITVPAYFDEAARAATRDAAQLAGFKVLRLLNEPTAAALAYGLDQGSEGIYGVYDLGGGTFDFSLLNMEKGVFQVLGTSGDLALGGDDFDQAICAHFLKDRFLKFPFAQKKQALDAARHAKENLLDHVSFSFFPEEKEVLLSRPIFESLVAPFIQRSLFLSQKVLDDTGVQKEQLEGLIFVGGSTRIPYVAEMVGAFFEKPILSHLNPDYTVALGAALQAEALTYGAQHLLLDVTPLSLGLETMGGLVEPIIRRNSPIPIKVTQEFTTFQAGQTAMSIHVLQGERERIQDCRSLAHFELQGIPPLPAGIARVQVTFSIDADGLLTVAAEEKTTGIMQNIQVKPAYGLSMEAIAEMLLESRQREGEDLVYRVLAQKKIEGRQSLQEIQALLEKEADLFMPDEKKEVAQACQHLQKALSQEDFGLLSQALSDFTTLCLPFMERRLNRILIKP